MIFGEGPIIKNIAGDLNKLFLQGSRVGQPIINVEGDAAADQGTADLLAAMDPVIQEISVGMSGEQSTQHTISGTPPLSLPNSLGKPLKAWSVELLPYQEGSGDPSPDNVRPILGTDKLNLFVEESYDPSATPKAVIIFDNTLYGGTAEIVAGTGSDGFASEIITKDSAWYGFSTGTGNSSAVVQLANYQNVKYVDGVASYNGALGSVGPELQNYWINPRQNETCADMGFAYSASGQLRIHRSDVTNITDLDSFKAALPDIQIVYPLATPTPYTIDGHTIHTPSGTATTWATAEDGTVDSMEVTYVGKT